MTQNHLKYLFLSFLCISLVACSSRTTVKSDLGIRSAPDWVNEGKQALNDGGKRFFRGVGTAVAMNDEYLQKTTADNRARAEVAQIFSSYINVIANDYSAALSDTDEVINEQATSNTIKNVTKMDLIGAEIIARWKDKRTGIIYSLAELDMKKFKTVASKAKDMDANLKSYIAQKADSVFDIMEQRN